jgi:hypothetical protein
MQEVFSSMGVRTSDIPTWMAKIKAEQDAMRDRGEIEAKDRALLEALMRTEEPKGIWERLKAKLENIGSLSDKTIGIRISVSDVSSTVESMLRVEASLPGITRIGECRSAYTDVFFTPEEFRIRCLDQFEEELRYFSFCTFRNSLTLSSGSQAITPEQAASNIIEHLVSVLRSQRN